MSRTIVATVGAAGVDYPASAWIERDNFCDLAGATAYARTFSRMYRRTPYRIVTRRARFVVQFVPEWKLRAIAV